MDAKVGFQHKAFRFAANVGIGMGKTDFGFDEYSTGTLFGGLFGGTKVDTLD